MVKKQRISYIPPNESFWIIPEVVYRGETGTYRLFEKMTPVMIQDQLAELYELEKAREMPRPMDSVLHFAIMNASYNLRHTGPDAKKLRAFLHQNLRRWPNTMSRIVHVPSAEDRVIHNYKTSDEYSIDEQVVGPNNCVKDIQNKKVLESLLGTQDVVQIDKVFQWINRTDSFIWRLNSKPKQEHKRVVGFSANPTGLNLSCNRRPFILHPAFRVLRVD